LEDIRSYILACRRCPRLSAWREAAAANPPKRFQGQSYHAKPVPAFGDPSARILVVGLAPAAHGANRTGRMFTGDRSGDWLYGALHRAGLASQASSVSAHDGLVLKNVLVTAACRCAPPDNKPAPEEMANCAPFLDRELDLLWPRLRVIVVLGGIALKATLAALERRGAALPSPRPKFGHGRAFDLGAGLPRLIASYHPSQQNTFTGRLTEPMFAQVWAAAVELAHVTK
jgi:uracil-DNA glycosylase family 4